MVGHSVPSVITIHLVPLRLSSPSVPLPSDRRPEGPALRADRTGYGG